jgi:hypothetical protein
MAKAITPEGRIERWKKLWSTPRPLSTEEADKAFEDFVETFVPGHMEKKFRQFFGTPRAKFGNRFFRDDVKFHAWDRSLASLGIREGTHAEATVIYAGLDDIEAHRMRGETRRTLKDLVIDDWHAACAIAEGEETKLYIFIEPKMRGCIVLRVGGEEDGP